MKKEQFRARYLDIARRFIERRSEEELYQVSLVSREIVKAELAPHEMIEIHATVQDELFALNDPDRHREICHSLTTLLMEVMVIYSQAHRDVQDLVKQLEANYRELDAAKQTLEETYTELQERTSQLVQSEKMKALGEMAAGVAHEINEPLNTISLVCDDIYRDIARDRLDTTGLAASLQEVLGEVKRLASIIDHMRVFTRKTEGTRLETLDINTPIEGVFRIFGQQLLHRGIDVVKEIGDTMLVMGDPVRLEQVLLNLITNARDAIQDNDAARGKRILLKAYTIPAGQTARADQVAIQVCDNGHGIPPHLRDRIFEPFYTGKAPGEGTGLGLSVAKQIIEDHRGQINVESDEDRGTTFTILLPGLHAEG